ncbi:MAG: MFS transporter [Pseudomonadales bacterium]|nr:MFS transporter [Pseudomonadales bacterium]MCP5183528.1 MFS transporter [Pseudomonadales bacterium]
MSGFVANRLPALTYPLYRRYWLASLASVGGTQLITLGQGWLVFKLTGSAWNLGLLGAAVALPNIVLTLIGGVIADRFDKRVIMMFTSVATASLLALLSFLDYQGSITLWQVLAIAATISLITGIDWPARVAIYPHLVGREAFINAVALNTVIWQGTRMAMPAFGGMLIAAGGTWLLFALGSAGFLIMFAVVSSLRVHVPAPNSASPWRQLQDGVRFILHSNLFGPLLVIVFAGMFFCSAYVQLMPVFAAAMGGDETAYGYLLATGGLGAVIGTIVASGFQHHARLGQLMLGAAALTAVTTALFAWVAASGLLWSALAMTLLASLFSSVFIVTSQGVLQLTVPDHLRGRVMGIHAIGYSLIPLGGLLLGGLTGVVGVAMAVTIGSVVYALAILLAGVRNPRIRDWSGATPAMVESEPPLRENEPQTV